MSDYRQLIQTFNLELNSDDDITLLKDSSRRIRNVVFNEDGNSFVATNTPGNTQVTTLGFNYGFGLTFTPPSGTNSCKHTVENKEENAVIVFLYNSDGYHSIYQYYRSENHILWVLKGDMASGSVGSVLNFHQDKEIDADIIGTADDKYLIWTDGYNGPRIINIKKAIDYSKGLTSGYSAISSQVISFYKNPPINVSAEYGSNSSSYKNLLRQKLWQFAVRKKYVDGTYSVLSQFSNVPTPVREQTPDGVFIESNTYNKITITCKLEQDENIDKYELCYRNIDAGGGVPSSWYLSDITPTITSIVTFVFTNEFSGVVLADSETSRIYDYIPDTADKVCVIDSNRVVFGGVTEGYDNVTQLDIVLDHNYENTYPNEPANIHAGDDVFVDCLPLATFGTNVTATHYGSNNSAILNTYAAVNVEYVGCKVTNTTKGVYGWITGATPGVGYDCVTDDGNGNFGVFDWDNGDGFRIDRYIVSFDIDSGGCLSRRTALTASQSTSVFRNYNSATGTPTQIATIMATAIFTGFTLNTSGSRLIIENTSATSYYVDYIRTNPEHTIRSFLSGSKHVFAIQYLNNGKPFYAASDKSNQFTIEIPTPAQAASSSASRLYRNYYNSVNCGINHIPPEYATHYQWLYLGSDVSRYREFALAAINSDLYNTDSSMYTRIKISEISRLGDAYGVDDYAFEVNKGDRLKIIGYFSNASFGYDVYGDVKLFVKDYDYEVLAVDDTYMYVEDLKSFLAETGPLIYPEITPAYCARVYKQSNLSESSGIYQSVSPVYEIKSIGGLKYHSTGTTNSYKDQIRGVADFSPAAYTFIDSALSAFSITTNSLIGRRIKNNRTGLTGTITANSSTQITSTLISWAANDSYSIASYDVFNPYFANCFLQINAFVNSNNIFKYFTVDHLIAMGLCYGRRESESFSIMYDSSIKSFGRPNVINNSTKRGYYNKIRWGGLWFDNSGVSYFNKFDYDDQKPLSDANGLIKKIDQKGNTLRVYQERKVTSFYLGTTSSVDANGTQSLVFSNQVMSDGRFDITNYGCTSFESFSKNVRNSYFFDLTNGTVLRDSLNGLDDVNFKYSKFFKDKASEILAYGKDDVDIIGCCDEDTGYYYITFIVPGNPSHAINDTVAFDEAANKWRSGFDFIPDRYGKLSGQVFVTVKNGYVYTHNTNPVRNNFYGQQYSSEIWIHAADNPIAVKLFDTIEITSTGQWSCPDNGDVFITEPVEMKSRLVAGRFKLEEGIYRASFLRDMLNGGSLLKTKNLMNGRKLRGYEITCKLKNSDTTESNLRSVVVSSTISK